VGLRIHPAALSEDHCPALGVTICTVQATLGSWEASFSAVAEQTPTVKLI